MRFWVPSAARGETGLSRDEVHDGDDETVYFRELEGEADGESGQRIRHSSLDPLYDIHENITAKWSQRNS